jgi:hypothetical protein
MKMAEIAERIRAHLKTHEADEEWNQYSWTDPRGTKRTQRHLYYANAGYHVGSRITVLYVSYQGQIHLKKAEALAYLEWLDAGNRGTHWEQQREAQSEDN